MTLPPLKPMESLDVLGGTLLRHLGHLLNSPGLPGVFLRSIAFPSNLIFYLSTYFSGIVDLIHLVFFFPFRGYYQRWWSGLLVEIICGVWV
jgi:hypothetical protein